MSIRSLLLLTIAISPSISFAETACEIYLSSKVSLCNTATIKEVELELTEEFLNKYPEQKFEQENFYKEVDSCTDEPSCSQSIADRRLIAIKELKKNDAIAASAEKITPEPVSPNTIQHDAAPHEEAPSGNISAHTSEAPSAENEYYTKATSQNSKEPMSNNPAGEIPWLWVVLGGITLIGIFLSLGSTKTIVIFENFTDQIVVGISPIISVLVGTFSSQYFFEGSKLAENIASGATASLLAVWVFYVAYRANSNNPAKAILSFIARCLLSILALALFLLFKASAHAKSESDRKVFRKKDEGLNMKMGLAIASGLYMLVGYASCRNKKLVGIEAYIRGNYSAEDIAEGLPASAESMPPA